jgi:hypothetical protein
LNTRSLVVPLTALAALLVAAPAMAAIKLGEPKLYGAQEVSPGVAIADFNGDGRGDVANSVAPTQGAGYVQVRLNTGGGALGGPGTFPVNENPQELVAGDLNGDGRQDLVTVTNNPGQDSLTVLINNIEGFDARASDTASGPRSVALADMDGDRDLDAVVAGFEGDRSLGRPPIAVAVHRNQGNGTFGPAEETRVADEGEPTDVTTGDVDGNGTQDVVYGDFNFGTGGRVYVLLNTGGGALAPPATYLGTDATEVAAGDLNGDGDADVVSASPEPGTGVYTAQGGVLSGPRQYAGSGAQELALADLDGDRDLDVVAGANGLRALANRGDGTFALAPTTSDGGSERSITTGDLNGDGLADVVTASFGISVYLNRGGRPRASISGVPKGCAPKRFNVRVRVSGPFKRADVRVDGRRVKRSTKRKFKARVSASKRGLHKVQVIVTPRSGKKVKKTKRFRRC